jgi:hypothetical protein
MARVPAAFAKDEVGAGGSAPDSPVTLATVLSRLAGELADLRATHAAEQALSQRLGLRARGGPRRAGPHPSGEGGGGGRTGRGGGAGGRASAGPGRRAGTARRERSARATLLLDVERLLQAVEHRLGAGWALPLPGRRRCRNAGVALAGETPPIVAVATGLGRRGARRGRGNRGTRKRTAAGAGAVLVTDEAGPWRDVASPPLRVVRLPRPRALPPADPDAYRAGRLRLLLEIWRPARVVPFGPDAARLLALAGKVAERDQAASAVGDLAARS